MVESIVKPLEWKTGYFDDSVTIVQAATIGGIYQVRTLNGVVWLDDLNTQTIYPDVIEAKAAAQAGHERRILSALSVDPASFQALKDENVAKDARIAELAWARKAYLDAVTTYNERLKLVRAERERGNYSMNVDAENRAISVTQSAFVKAAEDITDEFLARATLRNTGGEQNG